MTAELKRLSSLPLGRRLSSGGVDRDGERRQDVRPHLRMGPARPGEGQRLALMRKQIWVGFEGGG